jgi:hypothetical protein
MYREALSVFNGLGDGALPNVAMTYARADMDTEARQALDEIAILQGQGSHVSPFSVALIYAGLGEEDRVFEYLELAYETRDFGLPFINVESALDSLRNDPRFTKLVRRLGLEL